MTERKERTAARSSFTRASNSLNAAINCESIVKITVMKRFETVKAAWNVVQEKHEAYILTLENCGDADDKWINELQTAFDDLEMRADCCLEKMAEQEKKKNQTSG